MQWTPQPTQANDRWNIQGFGAGLNQGLMEVISEAAQRRKQQEQMAELQRMLGVALTGAGGPMQGGGMQMGGAPMDLSQMGGAQMDPSQMDPARFVSALLGGASTPEVFSSGMKAGETMGVFKDQEKIMLLNPETGQTDTFPVNKRQLAKDMGFTIRLTGKENLMAIENLKTGGVLTLPEYQARRKLLNKKTWRAYEDVKSEEERQMGREDYLFQQQNKRFAPTPESDFRTFWREYKKENPKATPREIRDAWTGQEETPAKQTALQINAALVAQYVTGGDMNKAIKLVMQSKGKGRQEFIAEVVKNELIYTNDPNEAYDKASLAADLIYGQEEDGNGSGTEDDWRNYR